MPLLISALPLVVFSSPDILSNPAILIGFQLFNLIVPSLMMTEGGFYLFSWPWLFIYSMAKSGYKFQQLALLR